MFTFVNGTPDQATPPAGEYLLLQTPRLDFSPSEDYFNDYRSLT